MSSTTSPTTRCPECGASVAGGTTFCPSCGEMILAAAPPAPAPPSAPARPPVEPTIVPVPQRPTRQQPAQQQQPRARTRPAPRQGGYRQPPARGRYQVPPPPPPGGGLPQGYPGGFPQGFPPPQERTVRRGPGCGGMLLRLMLLLLAVPVVLGILGAVLGGGLISSQESSSSSTPRPEPTSVTTNAWPGPTDAAASTGPGTGTAQPTSSAAAAAPTSTSIDDIIDQAIGSATAGAPGGYPPVRITGRECDRSGSGPYAAAAAGNGATTCAFATATRDAYLAARATGGAVSLDVYSRARGSQVRLACTGAQPVRCSSSAGALVYLYGGTAVLS